VESWALNIVFDRAEDSRIASETLAALLEDLGAVGWHEKNDAISAVAMLSAFFPVSVSCEQAVARVREAVRIQRAEGVLKSRARLSATAVEAHDWVAECRRGFRGVRVAPGLRVVPPWRARAPSKTLQPGTTEIIIEPGMAFGTGLHETTRVCLRLLQREIRGGERVADVGAGSGILSIGAVQMGARSALAIEVDPQAHENLMENIRLNGLGRRVQIFKDDLRQYVAQLQRQGHVRRTGGFDSIVCNILVEKMLRLLPLFRALVRPRRSAIVIVSGHLWTERRDVATALADAGIQIAYERRMGDWGAIAGRLSS